MSTPTLRDVAQLLAKNEMTATEHVRATLDALDDLLGTPWENLVAARDDEAALAAAARADAAIAAGDWIGPLHGVTVAVKDNIDVAGMPTRCGSAVLADAPPAASDARIVTRLREAGAIVVAKTHLHEFAYGPTGAVNASGPAAHPHDPGLITGGSSSGSAALVAKGVVPLALGTDTGCSARTPAALCGVVGFKPSFGALPTGGVFPLSTTFDHVGLLAADVLDVSLAWGAIPGIAHVRTPVAGLRVGRLRGENWDVADAAIEAAVDAACRSLVDAGAEVVDVELPETQQFLDAYPIVTGSEAYETHRAWFESAPERYQSPTAALLAAQKDRPAVEYLHALRTVERLRRQALSRLRGDLGLDALITATTPLRAVTQEQALSTDPAVARTPLLRMCSPFNALGIPAISAPVTIDDGAPVGIQLIGLPTTAGGHGSHPAESAALACALAVSS
ncbi:amidase [Rhodococcus sp. AG1013]|uniref:amidase n=1 Tax=unclassified Rhodococcus (in: high G+C Gram-positive bacteria) TaxID=192944 RepID=UPI000E2CE12F|nr:amidase [Rhodococcus sp. AG1013]RDI16913.1 aspartyl-tRNA(Asn)/glutamyl-tRNA(Gln) amidotransferase subunit A [Rhodococcus sp. AG1013]